MFVRRQIRTRDFPETVWANTWLRSLPQFVAIITIATIMFGFTAYGRAATGSTEDGRGTANAADVPDKAGATNATAAEPLPSAPSKLYFVDTGNSAPTAIDSVVNIPDPGVMLPLSRIANEPAPHTNCRLVISTLCGAVKNRFIFAAATLQTTALIGDGITTRQYLRRGYVEVDPFTRVLLGRRPMWARMAPLGTVQVLAGMWLGERMSTSRNRWIRRFWWLPQAAGIAGNAAATANNLKLR